MSSIASTEEMFFASTAFFPESRYRSVKLREQHSKDEYVSSWYPLLGWAEVWAAPYTEDDGSERLQRVITPIVLEEGVPTAHTGVVAGFPMIIGLSESPVPWLDTRVTEEVTDKSNDWDTYNVMRFSEKET